MGRERDPMSALRGPDVLAHVFDPVTQLVHALVPLLQPLPHSLDLLHVQHLGLDPVDVRDLRDLVDLALDEAQRQRLHDEVLDLVRLDLGLRGDVREGQVAVVGRTVEDHLRERGQRDLLVQEDAVLLQQAVLGDVARQHVVGRQVAAVEGEEEVPQPGVRRLRERV